MECSLGLTRGRSRHGGRVGKRTSSRKTGWQYNRWRSAAVCDGLNSLAAEPSPLTSRSSQRTIPFRQPRRLHAMRVVIVLALMLALVAAQKRKEEPEYDDDYDYDNDAPVKDTKKDVKDSKTKPFSAAAPTAADSTKDAEQDSEKPKKKLEHPTSIFLKPRNTRVHSKVTPAPGQRNKPTLPSFIKNPATGGQVSTTVTPRPPGVARAERTTVAPLKSNTKSSRSSATSTTTTTTTPKPKRGGSSSTSATSGSNKKSSRTTEAPPKDGRRFGGSGVTKAKTTKSSRFNKENKSN